MSATVSPSNDAVARWRRYYRRLRWDKGNVALRRPLLVVQSMLWPGMAALHCARETLRLGRAARAMGAPLLLRQFLEQWWLCVTVGCRPDSYYKFRLYLPTRRRDGGRFIHEPEALAVLRKINDVPQMKILDDKHHFAAACDDLRLPHVATLAYFADGQLVESETGARGDAALPREDLFLKCTNLLCGRGVEHWRWNAADAVYERDHQELTPAELFVHLIESSKSQVNSNGETWHGSDGKLVLRPRPWVVQCRVENHPDLACYSNSALCTVRIVTARALGGEPKIIAASLRMPARGSGVDNFAAGGVAAPIDLATGVLGTAVSKDPTLPPTRNHPDCNLAIEGRVIPSWADAQALCLRAHHHFDQVATVGWDVAITPAGPLLLEANPVWCVELIQMSHGRPLGDTPLAELCMTHVS